MNTNRLPVIVSVVLFAALFVAALMSIPMMVEAGPAYSVGIVEAVPARMTAERIHDEQSFAAAHKGAIDFSLISPSGGPVLYTSDRLREEHLGLISPSGGPVLYTSDRLREEHLGGVAPAKVTSTSDVLRDRNLGGAQVTNFESTSDTLRDRHLGGGTSVETVTPIRLHDEFQGGAGFHSGQ